MEKKRRCILVTLTAPNVPGCDLKVEINKYNKAVDKLFKRQKYKHSIKGYLQKIEVTYNKESYSYQPHFHILVSVDSRYFLDKREYIRQNERLKDCQEIIDDYNTTQVDTRRVKMINNKKIDKSILELTR